MCRGEETDLFEVLLADSGPDNLCLRFLVPKPIEDLGFETQALKHWVSGPEKKRMSDMFEALPGRK